MTEIDFRPISGVFDPRMPLKQSKVSIGRLFSWRNEMIYKRRIKNTFYLYEVESVPNCISLSWLHSLPTPLRSYEYQELKGMDEYSKFQKLLVDDYFIYMISL